jgi:carbamoyltransferase
MYILGISAFFHDSAACLVRDGVVVAAAQEERFTRRKHDNRFPRAAVECCLRSAGITLDDVDHVAFYEKPHLKFERILSTYADFYPKGFGTFLQAIPAWVNGKFRLPEMLASSLLDLSPSRGRQMKWEGRLIYPEHHHSHAASAYFPSPFSEAAIMVLDGVGEWSSTTLAVGRMNDRRVPGIEFIREIRYPHSLGMLYSAFTYYLGFKVNSGEYKVMGLAPYGEPRYTELILDRLIEVKPDGSYRLNLDHFTFPFDHIMINSRFDELFELPRRTPEALLTQKHFDIAASLQKVTERVVSRIGAYLHGETGLPALCMAGGVALNCVANGELLRSGPFRDLWIQPAAGDAGGALGAALYVWHEVLGERRVPPAAGERDLMQGSYLGPRFTDAEIREVLQRRGIPFHVLTSDEVPERAAELLASEQVVGWFQGRMEFGPRALGARSIIGDARSRHMQKTMNLKIKYRESFRPFAPTVLRERVQDWFGLAGRDGAVLGGPDSGYDSPYMLLVAPVRADRCNEMTSEEQQLFGIDKLNVVRSQIPSCTHVDYSARIQTVSPSTNPRYHRMIQAFERRTGVPVIVNTSFNVRGEPIVCTPEDALNCFLGTEMDALMLENTLVLKSEVPDGLKVDYKDRFELD